MHSQGKLLGDYISPGAFLSDSDIVAEGTNIQLDTLFNTSQPLPQCTTQLLLHYSTIH